MKRLALLLMVISCSAFGTTRYVVPAGGVGSGNALTLGTAWNIEYGLGDSSNAANGTADTIIVKAGEYDVGIYHGDTGFRLRLRGISDSQRLRIKGEMVNGRPATIFYQDLGYPVCRVYRSWLIIQDIVFEDRHNPPLVTEDGGTCLSVGNDDGVDQGVKIINCVTKNGMVSGFASDVQDKGDQGAEQYGLIAYFNGRNINDTSHGYGVYSQSDSARGYKYMTDCWSFHNYGGYQYHMYSAGSAQMDNWHFRHVGWFATQTDADIAWRDGIGNGTGNILDSCYAFRASLSTNLFEELRRMDSVKYRGNWFIGGKIAFRGSTQQRQFTGNSYWGNMPVQTMSGVEGETTWDTTGTATAQGDSAGYATTVSPPANRFSIGGSMPAWADTVFYRPNQHDPHRAFVVVYNADSADTQSFDMDSVLSVGDSLYVFDIQNYFGAAVLTAHYAGGNISLPMSGRTIEAPVSVPPEMSTPTHTDNRFNVFVLYSPDGTFSTAAGQQEPDAPPSHGTRLLINR